MQMQLRVRAGIVDHSAAKQKQYPLQIITVLMIIYQIIYTELFYMYVYIPIHAPGTS